MSSVTAASPRKSLHKRVTALEKTEMTTATANTTASEAHVGAFHTQTSGSGTNFTFANDTTEPDILVGHGGIVCQGGAGAVTYVAGSGVNALLNNAATAKTNGSDAVTYWMKVAANTYRIWGDLAAS